MFVCLLHLRQVAENPAEPAASLAEPGAGLPVIIPVESATSDAGMGSAAPARLRLDEDAATAASSTAAAAELEPAASPDDNMTVCSDRTEIPEGDTEADTDEERGYVAANLRAHMDAIAAMGLNRPPLPRPLQESRRAWLRRVRNKHKKKSWAKRNALAPKSRAQPATHKGLWENYTMPRK